MGLIPHCDCHTLHRLRDPEKLLASVDLRMGWPETLRLSGVYSISDIARFILIVVLGSLYSKLDLRIARRQLERNDSLANIHRYVCRELSTDGSVSDELLTYPILHIDHTKNDQMNGQNIIHQVKGQLKEIRGVVTGDMNWDKKSDEVIRRFSKDSSFSTRDSIRWYTHASGSMKIYSSELETDLLTSKVLIVFELEILLTMKQFAYKVLQNLNYYTELSNNYFPLRSLAKLRDREMRRLDEYYNLDALSKDTTAQRLPRFRAMMGIDELLTIVLKKFESLNIYMSTEYQSATSRRQLGLTVVFGVFGAGSLVFGALNRAIDKNAIVMDFAQQTLWTTGTMVVVGLLIVVLFGRSKVK